MSILTTTPRTMTEVVGELGSKEPNCAELPAMAFLSELANNGIPTQENNAKRICEGCIDKCGIKLGQVSVVTLLAQEAIA